jgi:hypothetical protein
LSNETRRSTYFDLFVVHGDGLHREVDPNRVSVAFLIESGLKSAHHARLTDAAVTDEHHLEEEVEGLVPHGGRGLRTGETWTEAASGTKNQNKGLLSRKPVNRNGFSHVKNKNTASIFEKPVKP